MRVTNYTVGSISILTGWDHHHYDYHQIEGGFFSVSTFIPIFFFRHNSIVRPSNASDLTTATNQPCIRIYLVIFKCVFLQRYTYLLHAFAVCVWWVSAGRYNRHQCFMDRGFSSWRKQVKFIISLVKSINFKAEPRNNGVLLDLWWWKATGERRRTITDKRNEMKKKKK